MGYTGDSLAGIAPEGPMIEAARRTTERVGNELQQRVKRHTPVAKPPPGAAAEWLASRGRMPGTLRESWKVGEVEASIEGGGASFTIEVYTLDPVAPYVEYPTAPHLIFPKRPGGRLRFWDAAGNVIYAYIVHHPGTQGSYMLATALAEIDQLWQEIGAEEMERWAREMTARI